MRIKSVKTPSASTLIYFASTKDDKTGIQDFKGEVKEVAVRYAEETTCIYCGIGNPEGVDAHILRTAAALGIQKSIDLKRHDVSVIPGRYGSFDEAIVEGICLGGYSFTKYKREKPSVIRTVELCDGSLKPSDIANITALCSAVNYARDLVNDNAHVVTPQHLADEAMLFKKDKNITVKVINEKELERIGCGLLSAVGRGSPYPPRLIIIEYRGAPNSKKVRAVVGKGITFDTGGLNLKKEGGIETMRCDMAGTAAVLGMISACSALKLKTNVIGVCACAHNAIDGNSYFVGDVYTAYNGTTVEINNTDAEGRLALADAIAYVQKQYTLDTVIDLATLTGGVLTALGDLSAGLFANSEPLADALTRASQSTGERLWRLPMYQEYSDSLKGDISDLRNLSKLKRGQASSIIGAVFIRHFVEPNVAWAHLDIAGTAWNEYSSRGDVPQYATGYGVRLLVEYLRGVQEKR